MQKAFAFFLLFCATLANTTTRAAENGFSHWAAVVVAGDWHTHDGGPSEAFDNARRDVSAELQQIGFRRENIAQFSVRPWRYRATHARQSNLQTIGDRLFDLSRHADGCLLYFSSHGAPEGIVLGRRLLEPDRLAAMTHAICGSKPTVIVLSACFSGGFLPTLAGPERFVLTAARNDRASFGCSSSDKYPFFDSCFLKSVSGAHDFPNLADRTRSCVASLEKETGMTPSSEPQLSVGSDILAQLPKW